MEKAHERFKKLICGHFSIFDFRFLDTLHLPFQSQRFLAFHQRFTHFWSCSLWKVLIRLSWCAREHWNYKWLIWQCYFNRIHLAKTALLCFYAKKVQKDIIRWQVLLATIRDGYLMIAVHCVLTAESCPQHEVQRIFQQFLRAVCLIIQLFESHCLRLFISTGFF